MEEFPILPLLFFLTRSLSSVPHIRTRLSVSGEEGEVMMKCIGTPSPKHVVDILRSLVGSVLTESVSESSLLLKDSH